MRFLSKVSILLVFCMVLGVFAVNSAELPEWTKGIKVGSAGEVTIFGMNAQASLYYCPRTAEWPTAYTYEVISAYDRFLYVRVGASTKDLFQTDARICGLAGLDIMKIDDMLDKYCGLKTFGEPVQMVENWFISTFGKELKINFLITYDEVNKWTAGIGGDIIDLIPK